MVWRVEAELGPRQVTSVFVGYGSIVLSAAKRNYLQVEQDQSEDLGIRTGLRHRDSDVSNRRADSSADLQKFESDGPALCTSQRGVLEPETAQRMQEHVGG